MNCFIYSLLVMIPFSACGQSNLGEGRMAIRDHIKQLKNFADEPIYQVRVETDYAYTILVNGIPIASKNVPYLRNYLTEINSCIPRSGEQQLEIRIYPRYTDLHTQEASLQQGVDFELTVERTAWKNGSLEEPTAVYSFSLPDGDYTGQSTFTYSDAFTADVPYKLIDWQNGRTFGEQDTVALKEKALEVYDRLVALYENQRGREFANAIGQGLFNLYQSSYFNEEEALDHLEHQISFIDKEKRDLAELADYKLEVLAGGKLLSLRRTDGFNRCEGVLRRYYQRGPKEMVHVYDVLLYAPQSAGDEGVLEVIWHNNLVKGAHP